MYKWYKIFENIGLLQYLRKQYLKSILALFVIITITIFEFYILTNIGNIFEPASIRDDTKNKNLTLLLVLLFTGVFKIIQIYLCQGLVYNFGGYKSKIEFENLLNSEVTKVRNLQSSEVIKRFDLINLVTINAINPAAMFIFNSTVLISITVGAATVNPYVTLISLLVIVTFYIVIMFGLTPKLYLNSKRQSSLISQKLANIRGIHSASAELSLSSNLVAIKKKYSSIEDTIRNLQTWNLLYGASPRFIFETLIIVIFILIFTVTDADNNMIMSQLVPFGYAAFRLLPTTQAVYSNWASMSAHATMIHELSDNLTPELTAYKTPSGEGGKPTQCLKQESKIIMDINHLSMKIYNKISIDVKNQKLTSGRIWLVQGPSGSGKSTLVDILCKFISCNADINLWTNNDQITYADPEWRHSIAVATQKGAILNMSIRDNLNFFSKEKHADKILLLMMNKLNLQELIKTPNDLDKTFSEDAANISGGQRQRISLARVLLSDRPVAIFDESTSNLDRLNQETVEKLIEEKSKTALCFVVSHTPDTILGSNIIRFSEDGTSDAHPQIIKYNA